MEDIFLSFGFRLGVWILLAISAIGVLGLYWIIRNREKRLELAYSYQELVRLCDQKGEEHRQLERQVRDLDDRKAERDRYQAEEARARQWIDSHDDVIQECQEQNNKLTQLRDDYNEYQRCAAQLAQLHHDRDALLQETDQLRAERDKRSEEVKETSAVYLTLSKELDQRKAQLEPITDQLRKLTTERDRQQAELKQATEEYMRVSKALECHRNEASDLETELDHLRARADRFKMENPFLADHQERISQQWKSLECKYQDVISQNRQQWESLEDQFKRLRDQAQRSTSSLSL